MDPKYFVGLFMSQYLIDRTTTTPCKSLHGEFLLFFHHIVAVYIYAGSLFFDPMNHLIVCLMIVIHWLTYQKGTGCILTVYTNKYCGIDIHTPFNDYLRILNLTLPGGFHNWLMLLMIISYDLFLISN